MIHLIIVIVLLLVFRASCTHVRTYILDSNFGYFFVMTVRVDPRQTIDKQ